MTAIVSTRVAFSNITLQPSQTVYNSVAGTPGTYYSFAASNAVSAVPEQQAVITVVNGWANQPATSLNGPWCAATNTSTSAVTFDLVLLTVTP